MNRPLHLFAYVLCVTAICIIPVSAQNWRNVLSRFIDFRSQEEPGHPLSENRIPFDLQLDDIATTVHNEVDGAHGDLFGEARNFMQGDMSPGAHPRILFSASEWETLTSKYAFERYTKNHWYKAFLDYSQNKGPGNYQLQKWAAMDTTAYTGEPNMNKTQLAVLADEVELMGEYHAHGMFMCVLHASVNEKYELFNGQGYLPEEQGMDMAINVIVNYAKIVLSHYYTYACEGCYRSGIMYSDLWLRDTWSVWNDWITGGLSIALGFDVLHDKFSEDQRRFIRSALGIMVTGREHWGISTVSNSYSPNAAKNPHRIFSNWATYHAFLFLTNLAIEGETDFDTKTSNLMIRNKKVGFDWAIHNRSIALFSAFMTHSIYPDGSSFEDGYTYSLAFREGSLGLIALAKRGINFIDTQKFRNFMYNNAQMHEPFRCGHFIGHSSGGGTLYPASYAFFRYAYPDSELNQMVWAQRMGLDFTSHGKSHFLSPILPNSLIDLLTCAILFLDSKSVAFGGTNRLFSWLSWVWITLKVWNMIRRKDCPIISRSTFICRSTIRAADSSLHEQICPKTLSTITLMLVPMPSFLGTIMQIAVLLR